MKKNRPLLSIGIIFKNEIRCLERCLKSLQPLRKAVPCEVIMADTGAIDGSRLVAERYADVLFDFPWINDFAAARNAVMDRCAGKWYLSLDADEWLDENISELVKILGQGEKSTATAYRVRIRNYVTFTINDEYAESMGLRLLWMDTGLRFQGSIHEIWPVKDAPALRRTLLHHDGYANSDSEAGKAKRIRNMKLLCQELERDPENLKLVLQCIESSRGQMECMDYIRRGLELVEAKKPNWKLLGPPIYRYGVLECDERELLGLGEWIDRSETQFPDSLFTRLDVNYTAFRHCWKDEKYAEAVQRGRAYLDAMADLREGRGEQEAQSVSTIVMSSPRWELIVRILMANACIKIDDPEQAWKVLKDVDGRDMNEHQVGSVSITLRQIHTRTQIDTGERLLSFYEQIRQPIPTPEQAAARQKTFMNETLPVFSSKYRDYEATLPYILRPAYTLFLPLAEICELGRGAAILDKATKEELEPLLCEVKNWNELPAPALEHALLAGAELPPMPLEQMDKLAGRVAHSEETIVQLALQVVSNGLPKELPKLTWVRAVILAAVRACQWQNPGQDMELCRAFAQVMGKFLPRYYTEETLRAENIQVLSPLFRFGWNCVQAFSALDAGDKSGYVRYLKDGLATCESMQPMVEFLLEHTPQLKMREAEAELLALAEKVRTLLAAYSPDDPAVVALKQSPVYQRVAWLIEAGEGLPQ